MTHLCLARPEVGRTVPGDEFDCPECRIVLLDAFRSDSEDVPREPLPVPAEITGLLHLTMDNSGRTVDLGVPRRDPCTPVWGTHPNGTGSGIWRVVCNCGWRKEGRYGLDARQRAEQVAREWAQLHMENSPSAHTTSFYASPYFGDRGGTWTAACTCGWREHGGWTARQGLEWARSQAEAAAAAHKENPEEEDQ